MPAPAVTLSSSAFDDPWGLAFDSRQNLWVANFIGGQVSKFGPKHLKKSGAPTPSVAITGVLAHSHQMTFGPVF